MSKKILLFVFGLLGIVLLAGAASAYSYWDGNGDVYKKEFSVKESWDDYGYTYSQRSVSKDPWGESVSYHKVVDYDANPYLSPMRNRVSDYWRDGPYHGYSRSYGYLDYHYDDAWRRDHYGTQYSGYYYQPKWNGNYWDHSY